MMDQQVFNRIMGSRPFNRDVYRDFFKRLYEKYPEKVLELRETHPSFRVSRAVNRSPRIDLGKREEIIVHLIQPGENRPGYENYDVFVIDEEKNVCLMLANNNTMAITKIIRVCNWLDVSEEDARYFLLGDDSLNNETSEETCTEEPAVASCSVEQIIRGIEKIGRKTYRGFFVRLYGNNPDKLRSLIGCSFSEDTPGRRTDRLDLGPRESLGTNWDHRGGPVDEQTNAVNPIDEDNNIWLMVNNDGGMAKRKLLWVCRKLELSEDEVRYYLFGNKKAEPTETPEEDSDFPKGAEKSTLEAIDSAIEKLQAEFNSSCKGDGADIVEIAGKINRLKKLRKELSELINRINSVLSE